MTRNLQWLFWLAALATLLASFALLSEVLLPFVLGLALAYMLNPAVNRLQHLNIGRTGAVLLVLVTIAAVLLIALIFLLPVLLGQLVAFVTELPAHFQKLQALLERAGRHLFGTQLEPFFEDAPGSLSDLLRQAAGKMAGGNMLKALWSSGMAVVNFFSLLFVTPVVTFFLLKDWPRMIAGIDDLLPRDHAPTIRLLARRIDCAIDGFIRGQALVSLLLGLFYAIALSFAGLNHALLIGLGAGLLSFIPFVGSLTGFVAAMVTAFGQFWPAPAPIAIIAGIFVFGQIVEGNFLTPKIIGDRVRLHPVWLIFALFVFAYLFGFAGLLVAVPVAAAIGVLVRFALEKYTQSPLYHGTSPVTTQAPAGIASAREET